MTWIAGLILVPAVICLVLLRVARRKQDTARRLIEQLLEREERLKLALWATGECYWDYDTASGMLSRLVSREALPAGARQELVVDARDLIHPDDLPLARERLLAYLDGRSDSLEIEARIAGPDGEWSWYRARGRAVERDAGGHIQHIAGTALDITTTRDADRERLIATEVLRSMNEAVSVLDRDFNFISINPSFSRMTGYSEEDIIGRNSSVLDSRQHDLAFYRDVRVQISTNSRWSGEIWQRRKDGEEFLCAIESSCIYDNNGHAVQYVAVLNDITQQKRTEQELRYLANFDTLTSLPNRSLLSDRLSRAIVRAHREDKRIAVLFLDLDRFKDINDSLGHAAGDRILRTAASRLQQTVGQQHTVARLGGDEFMVVLENLESLEQADRVAREVIMAFEAPLMLDDRREIAISPSIGISFYPDHAQVPTELIKQADTAMYQAKAAGRRTFMRYDETMDVAIRRRATISSALRKVLDRNELRLVYQPQLSLSTGQITGVEALLRWTSLEHGEIPPGDFIPMAEESGLILEIGEWVLREACLTVQRWRELGQEQLMLSVNVSVLQLLRGDFPEVVERVMQDIGLPAHALELELTESMLMANAADSAGKLQSFRELGVSLAIDDFGTGYSSLAYLKRLPFNAIKIDKAFIGDLTHDPEDAAITSTIITMAHSLGLNVIAEGVETEAQMRFLAGQGCDAVQGFWVARPLEPQACLQFLQSWDPARITARPAPLEHAP